VYVSVNGDVVSNRVREGARSCRNLEGVLARRRLVEALLPQPITVRNHCQFDVYSHLIEHLFARLKSTGCLRILALNPNS
jgi:hypothetical protein